MTTQLSRNVALESARIITVLDQYGRTVFTMPIHLADIGVGNASISTKAGVAQFLDWYCPPDKFKIKMMVDLSRLTDDALGDVATIYENETDNRWTIKITTIKWLPNSAERSNVVYSIKKCWMSHLNRFNPYIFDAAMYREHLRYAVVKLIAFGLFTAAVLFVTKILFGGDKDE